MSLTRILCMITILSCTDVYGFGDIVSPMPSTFLEVSTPNTHLLDQTGSSVILRGGTPRDIKDLESLINFGITKIIIFKNESKREVTDEINALMELHFNRANIIHIPVLWRGFISFRSQCEMTLKALQEIETAQQNKESLFFHCTVGEDRTGYLSALWKAWKNPRKSKEELFMKEMCAYGFEGSNPQKPEFNVRNISAYLTPLYLEMHELILSAAEKGLSLGEISCPDKDFVPDFNTRYRCI